MRDRVVEGRAETSEWLSGANPGRKRLILWPESYPDVSNRNFLPRSLGPLFPVSLRFALDDIGQAWAYSRTMPRWCGFA